MKKVFATTTAFLLLATLSLNAGEKRYLIEVASADRDVFGHPVAFHEVPAPTPYAVPAPGPTLAPVPDPQFAPSPLPPVASYQAVELFSRVKYEDLDNVHPHAVKKIVAVKDPCAPKTLCGTCEPPCVYVMICVPPCDKFEFDVKRKDHSKVEYDYGKYEIEITSKDGYVKVDYDD